MQNDRFVLPVIDEGNAKRSFVSRAGLKLEAAMETFQIDVTGMIAADLGANVGGFTDCLLQHGAAKVYSVDTAYGVIAWTLRKDPRVVVIDRTNALHVRLPEQPQIIAIDVGWTRQEKILPHAQTLLAPGGTILSLIKPHYESEQAKKQKGVLTPEESVAVLNQTADLIVQMGWTIKGIVKSPIEGQKGNVEFVAWLTRGQDAETR